MIPTPSATYARQSVPLNKHLLNLAQISRRFPPFVNIIMSVVKTETSAKPYLSEPLILGDLTLRNRNIMASLMRNRAAPTNVPNDTNLEYYTQRAKGGCGLILSEGTLVSQQGTEFPNAPGIWSEEHVRAWKKIVDSVHESGTYIFCQVCVGKWGVSVAHNY